MFSDVEETFLIAGEKAKRRSSWHSSKKKKTCSIQGKNFTFTNFHAKVRRPKIQSANQGTTLLTVVLVNNTHIIDAVSHRLGRSSFGRFVLSKFIANYCKSYLRAITLTLANLSSRHLRSLWIYSTSFHPCSIWHLVFRLYFSII